MDNKRLRETEINLLYFPHENKTAGSFGDLNNKPVICDLKTTCN